MNPDNSPRKSITVPVEIPADQEVRGEPIVLVPLSNGSLQITLPKAGPIYGVQLLGDALRLFGMILAEQEQARKAQERESRIVTPFRSIPPVSPVQ